jgi:hypothetical protein
MTSAQRFFTKRRRFQLTGCIPFDTMFLGRGNDVKTEGNIDLDGV